MSDFWENDDNSFRDGMEEVDTSQQYLDSTGGYVPQPVMQKSIKKSPPVQQKPSEDEDIYSEVKIQEDEEDYTAILSDANLRLEQGHLYKLIMNHSLFQDTDADEKAINNVQREIRKFAKERMEIMLGMRQEAVKNENQVSVTLPFNNMEVSILKKLASAATKGVSELQDDEYVAPVQMAPAQKKQGLSPIGNVAKKPSIIKIATKSQTSNSQKTLPEVSNVPLKRMAKSTDIDKILAEEGVSRELIEENYVPLEKPLEQMKPKDREKRVQESRERLSNMKLAVKSKSALPLPTFDQEMMLHAGRTQDVNSKLSMTSILIKAVNNKNNQPK